MESVGQGAGKPRIGLKERPHKASRSRLAPGFHGSPDDGEGLAPSRDQRLLLFFMFRGRVGRRRRRIVCWPSTATLTATFALAFLVSMRRTGLA